VAENKNLIVVIFTRAKKENIIDKDTEQEIVYQIKKNSVFHGKK
jgi:hypothetical protein